MAMGEALPLDQVFAIRSCAPKAVTPQPGVAGAHSPGNQANGRIRYARTARGIEAEISLADGSKAQRWTFAAMVGPG